MKKILIVILMSIIFVVIVLVVARNFIVKTAITKLVEAAAGVEVKIQNIDIGLFNSYVTINSLTVYNPAQFSDRLMVDLPQIYLDYDLVGFLKNKVHLKKLKIEIKELSVIMNEKGKLNINSLAVLLPKPTGAKAPEVKIDVLALKIGKVVSKGYFPVIGEKTTEFYLNIDETFNDVTDPSKVAGEILKKILSRINISDFVNPEISGQVAQIKQQTQEAVNKGAEEAKSVAEEIKSAGKETFEKTKEDLKDIFSK
jgi:hypothetical protein